MTDKEKITQLEKENAELKKQCQELKKELEEKEAHWYNIFLGKQTVYMETLAEMNEIKRKKELIHNARGAGRKVDYDKKYRDLEKFAELSQKGYAMKAIMLDMGISRSTFYRIQKAYRQMVQYNESKK